MAAIVQQPKSEDIQNVQPGSQEEQSAGDVPRQQSSLYVGDLAKDVEEHQLYELFSQVGPVLSLRICKDQVTKRSLGYGYVNYNAALDAGAAQKALDTLNYRTINGKPIRIMWSNRDPQFRKSGVGNIFIKNLDKSVDNKQLHDTFTQFGSILSCKVALDEHGNSRGYGFVHFINEDDAQDAINKVNNMQIKDKVVFVGQFQKKFERSNENRIFTNIYVKNLKDSVTDDQLNEEFSKFGKVTSAVVAKEGNDKKGFGFVNFDKPEDASKAVNELHDKPNEILCDSGTTLYVNRAEKKQEREAKLKQIRDDKIQQVHQKTEGMNVYVKNLSDQITNERLEGLFKKFGEISSAKVMYDQQGHSRGFGFVCFTTPEAAANAVVDMYGYMVDNKPLYVSHAQRKEVRRAQLMQYKNQVQQMQMMNNQSRQIPNYSTPTPIPFAPTQFMYPSPVPAGGRGMMPPYPYQSPLQPPTGGREGRMGSRGLGRGAMPPQPQMGAPIMGGMQQLPRGGGRGPLGYRGGRQNQNYRGQGRGYQGGRGRYQSGRRAANPYGGRGRQGHMYNRPMVNQNVAPPSGVSSQNGQANALQQVKLNEQNSGNQDNTRSLIQTLATKPEEEQKQMIGEQIYKQVQKTQPALAGKITGMLLEMGVTEVLYLVDSPSELQNRIDEAIDVLQRANMIENQQNGQTQPKAQPPLQAA